MGDTWGSWTLRHADADLPTVVAEATARLPLQVRAVVAEIADDYYHCLDAALAYDAPALLAEHLTHQREQLAALPTPVDRAVLLRSLCDTLGRHVDPTTRTVVNGLVTQTVLLSGQRRPDPSESVPGRPSRAVLARVVEQIDAGRYAEARGALVDALEQGAAPDRLLEEVLEPLASRLVDRQAAHRLQHTESERLQEVLRTLLFSLVTPDLSFPAERRHLLLLEPDLPVGWRASFPRLVLETTGWSVDAVTCEAGRRLLAETVQRRRPQAVVLPARHAGDLDQVRAQTRVVRETSPTVAVVLLGRPFVAVPSLARRLGADAGCGGVGSLGAVLDSAVRTREG